MWWYEMSGAHGCLLSLQGLSAAVQQCLWLCRFVGFSVFLSLEDPSVAGFPAWLERNTGALGTAGQMSAGRKYPELLFPKGKSSLPLPLVLSPLPLETVFPYLTFFCLLFKLFGCHPVTTDIPVTSFGI